MKSATAVLLIVLVGAVMVAGQRQGCPVTAFWRGIARARVQALLTMFPDLAEEIRNGQLGPNSNTNNQNNNLNRRNLNDGLNNNMNQQGTNQLPFNRPQNNGFNGQNGQQGGSLLDNLNGQQGQQGNLPTNDFSQQGNLPTNNLNRQNSLPNNGLQGSQTLNGQSQPSLSTPTIV